MTIRGNPSRATILLFTWAAASVDAITYLTASVFTANMTGNAVLLGVSTGELRSTAAARSLVALIAFIAGVVLGALLAGKGGPGKPWLEVRRAVLVEAVILALFAAIAMVPLPLSERVVVLLLITASGFAMGLQSATVRRLSLPGIATTYITGTITFLFSGLVHHWDTLRGSDTAAAQSGGSPEMERSLGLQAEVFISYTVSALITAVLHVQWPTAVALLPLAAITMVAFTMYWRRPASPATA
jgi:uncharacterized membrane protein YoaK (UPF0700 family)